MPLVHDLEGTPDATQIAFGAASNSDTAGNNYFTAVTIGSGATLEYSSVPTLTGARHMRARTAAAGNNSCVIWTTPSRPLLTDDFLRFQLRIDVTPGLNCGIVRWFSAALGALGRIDVLNGSKMAIRNGADALQTLTGTGTTSSATTLAVDTLYRIEAKHHADLTTGNITVRIYDEAGALLEEFEAATPFAMSAAQSQRVDIGLAAAGANVPSASASQYFRFDQLAEAYTDWVGEVVIARPLRVNRGSLRW